MPLTTWAPPSYSSGETIAITVPPPQMHVNLGHLLSLLGPEKLTYNFVPAPGYSNLTLSGMKRCPGVGGRHQGAGAEGQGLG